MIPEAPADIIDTVIQFFLPRMLFVITKEIELQRMASGNQINPAHANCVNRLIPFVLLFKKDSFLEKISSRVFLVLLLIAVSLYIILFTLIAGRLMKF